MMSKFFKKKSPYQLLDNVFKNFRIYPVCNLRIVAIRVFSHHKCLSDESIAVRFMLASISSILKGDYSISLDILKESIIDFSMPHTDATFAPSLGSWKSLGVSLSNMEISCIKNRYCVLRQLWMQSIISPSPSLSVICVGTVPGLIKDDAMSLESCVNKRFNHIIRVRNPTYCTIHHNIHLGKRIDNILIGQKDYGMV